VYLHRYCGDTYSDTCRISFVGSTGTSERLWWTPGGGVANLHDVDADSGQDPDPACYFDVNPDPTFHFDADEEIHLVSMRSPPIFICVFFRPF
jgi:hypothetical protein